MQFGQLMGAAKSLPFFTLSHSEIFGRSRLLNGVTRAGHVSGRWKSRSGSKMRGMVVVLRETGHLEGPTPVHGSPKPPIDISSHLIVRSSSSECLTHAVASAYASPMMWQAHEKHRSPLRIERCTRSDITTYWETCAWGARRDTCLGAAQRGPRRTC